MAFAMGALLALMVDAWVLPMTLNSATPSQPEPARGLHHLVFQEAEATPASAFQPGCAECHQKTQERAVRKPAAPTGRDET